MSTKKFRTISILFILAILVTGCQNPQAKKAGVWYAPWTWGDHTLEESLETGCAGGATSTTVGDSTYLCQAEEPQAPPAPTQAPPAPTAQPIEEPVADCPTTEEAQDLMNISVQRLATEPCAWVWRGKPATAVATCPENYICTWDVKDDITVVHLGINQEAEIYAGTWRLVNAYDPNDAVYNACELYHKEKEFGANETPAFEVRFQAVPGIGPRSCTD
ncbi:hypothetical protein KKA02_04350 [Patescibacteria group bacterium]|nr:hypothetical protein [Patescibacteria group bacterium]